ncbi:MAG TPA: hypothetical protein VLW49_11870 [Gaiellaceae bacterium]|nr:hypothetical protein [Gaiellaceae bacterium]
MRLQLTDPAYTERFVAFMRSLGQSAAVAGPDRVEVGGQGGEARRLELELYLKVWRVLHPEADVELVETSRTRAEGSAGR